MKPPARARGAKPPLAGDPGLDYAGRLAALEARRRAADDRLVRKMIHVRDPQGGG